VPRWLLRLLAPYIGMVMTDTWLRVSNAKAKTELAWQPRFRNYREGIAATVSTGGCNKQRREPTVIATESSRSWN